MHLSVVALAAWAGLQAAPAARDTGETLREARRAATRYESLSRRLAPPTLPSGGRCDERVGRFCLRYDRGHERRPPDWPPPGVVRARRDAIEALRRALALRPASPALVGSLVRLLVEDGRPGEADAVARTFEAVGGDPALAALLRGMALHHAGDDPGAAAQFERALARSEPDDRERMLRLEPLLKPEERRAVEALSEAERARYRAAVWTLADPLYLTPGNESRNEHLARHAWSRILAEAPVVRGAVPWGDDLEELTLRYGVPQSRERVMSTSLGDFQVVEHYDSLQLAFVPAALITRGLPEAPPPGGPWPPEDPEARTGYAPATVRRLRPLPHQLSRFPAGDSVVVRLDGVLPLDTTALEARRSGRASPVEGGLFLLDDGHAFVTELRRAVPPAGDSARLAFEAVLPPGRYVYSLEALDPLTRLAGRARYPVEAAVGRSGGLALSDVVLVDAFAGASLPDGRTHPSFRPRADLAVHPGDTVGVYAEVHRAGGSPAARHRIELWIERRESGSPLGRALDWLGRRLGLVDDASDPEPRLSWVAGAPARGPAVVAVDLVLRGVEPGLHAIVLAVTEEPSGARLRSERRILVERRTP